MGFADDNIKFNKNGRKFSKRVENTVGKGEIAGFEQFLLFPQCFQKSCTADTYKPGLVWERVKVKEDWPFVRSRLVFCLCFPGHVTTAIESCRMDPALTSETHFKDLFAFLHKLYKAKSLCDFYIHAQDGVVCPVHKIVVAASSLYIYQMIASCPEMTQISLGNLLALYLICQFQTLSV